MIAKSAKLKPSVRLFPYDHEDLEPNTRATAEAASETFVAGNREEVDAALKEAREDIERGNLHTYNSLDEVYSDIVAEGRRRRAHKK